MEDTMKKFEKMMLLGAIAQEVMKEQEENQKKIENFKNAKIFEYNGECDICHCDFSGKKEKKAKVFKITAKDGDKHLCRKCAKEKYDIDIQIKHFTKQKTTLGDMIDFNKLKK